MSRNGHVLQCLQVPFFEENGNHCISARVNQVPEVNNNENLVIPPLSAIFFAILLSTFWLSSLFPISFKKDCVPLQKKMLEYEQIRNLPFCSLRIHEFLKREILVNATIELKKCWGIQEWGSNQGTQDAASLLRFFSFILKPYVLFFGSQEEILEPNSQESNIM